jgi:subtilisin family serine protease
MFPAAFWQWADGQGPISEDPHAVPITSVGALNPNGTDALFSNTGTWVRAYAPGASVMSTSPQFQGGLLPMARTEAYHRIRESADPDDYTGRFALWSGTSFSAPLLAGRVAARLLGLTPAPGESEPEADAVSRGRAAVAAQIASAP